MRPEVAIGALAPGSGDEIREPRLGPVAPSDRVGVGQRCIGERPHPAHLEPHRLPAQHRAPGTCSSARPPASCEGRSRHDTNDDLTLLDERDEGCPHRDSSNVVLRAIDRIDDPSPGSGALRRAELLAEHAVFGPLAGDHPAKGCLGRLVGLGDRGEVGLRLDLEVEGAESLHRDDVGGIGHAQGEIEIGSVVHA